MTIAEWNKNAALLGELWPGEFPTETSSAYQLILGEYPYIAVRDAIVQLAATDQWRPNPARILATGTLGEYHRRRADWRSRFVWLERNFGRPAAIAELDPEGTRVEHYPPEPEPGSTSALRSTPEQLAERAATYGIDLGAPQLEAAGDQA